MDAARWFFSHLVSHRPNTYMNMAVAYQNKHTYHLMHELFCLYTTSNIITYLRLIDTAMVSHFSVVFEKAVSNLPTAVVLLKP